MPEVCPATRDLLREIVHLGCSREKRGVALWEESKRLLIDSAATEHDYRMLLGTICHYAQARQQRQEYSHPAVIAVYERLEAFVYPEHFRAIAEREGDLVSV